MAASSFKKGKQAMISVSSSSSSSSSDQEEEDDEESEAASSSDQEEDEEGSEEEEESLSEDSSGSTAECCRDDDDDDDDDEEDEEDDDDDEEDEEDDDDDDAPDRKPTDEQLCNRVVNLLRSRKCLNTLKLEECKAYLRKHELRLSGTKATCIERILEHWRIKDGNGEKLYPRASFVINCTGDVCTGDVLLFKQKVYEKFDIVTRGGNVIGKRIIAGRVVKESYGAAKQQHTFTVEILWCKGVKALPPLFPLLVKGRNLYKLKTFRQRWSNEVKRSKVLAEKHRRGAAARQVRSIAKARSANRGSKRQRNPSTTRPPPNKRRKKESEPASRKKKPNTLRSKASANGPTKKASANGPTKMKRVAKARHPQPSTTHLNHSSYHGNGIHTSPIYPRGIPPYDPFYTRMELHRTNDLPNYNTGYSSAANGASHHHMLNMGNYMSHPYANYTSQLDPRTSSSRMFGQAHLDSGPTFLHRWR